MIQIRALNKTFPKHHVLRDVDLEIKPGVIFALLGPNGAGKSTLLKCLLGVMPPDPGGEMIIAGRNVADGPEYKQDIGYMPQIPSFPRNLTAIEIINLLEQLSAKRPVYRDKLIKELGIDEFQEKKFSQLSHGMRQKVNILQCFMYDNPLTIIDEPTASLDPNMSFYLKTLIRERKDQGRTVLFTSHIMSEVQELADEMAVLAEGRVMLRSSPRELIQSDGDGGKTLEEALRHYWTARAAK